MKILFISRELNGINGGTIISKRNLSLLKDIYGNENIIEILVDFKSKWSKLINILLYKPLGYTKNISKKINKSVYENNITLIFIDYSLLGGFSKILSTNNIPIITFFHNVEYVYYKEKLKVEGFINYPMVTWAKQNEKTALKYSNFIITLTKKDSDILKNIYGRNADLILPSSMPDKFTDIKRNNQSEKFHLFVGSAFFANIEGISWYIENVLKYVDIKLIVIGKGMELLKEKYTLNNLEVLGFVDELEHYYNNAEFIVSPIFSGSGMKTKTVEALMYGKTIFGTDEAFVGYELDVSKVGALCNSKEEFVNNINKLLNDNNDKFNQYSRNIFLSNYSNKSIKNAFILFLYKNNINYLNNFKY